MSTFPPASTLGVSERKAAAFTRDLVNAVAESISTAYHAMPDDYWSQHEWLARAAVKRALREFSTQGESWVHVTDFAVFSQWIDCLEPAPLSAEESEKLARLYGAADTSSQMDDGEWVEPLNPKLRTKKKEDKQE